MPCNNVSEILELHIDHTNHISHYDLRKSTCGAEVGSFVILQKWLEGHTVDDIMDIKKDEFLQDVMDNKTIAGERFMLEKQFNAILKTLKAVNGIESDGDCEIAELEYTNGTQRITSIIPVNLNTKNIQPCAGSACSGKCHEK